MPVTDSNIKSVLSGSVPLFASAGEELRSSNKVVVD